mgnify:CR=1 FL=1
MLSSSTNSAPRRPRFSFLTVVIVTACWCTQPAAGQQQPVFARLCAIAETQPIFTAVYDEITGSFSLSSMTNTFNDDDDVNEYDPDDGPSFPPAEEWPPITAHNDSDSSSNNNTTRPYNDNDNSRLRRKRALSSESSTSSSTSYLTPSSIDMDRRRTSQPTDTPSYIRGIGYSSYNRNNGVLVRECPCARHVYCEAYFDSCGLPVRYADSVGCFKNSAKTTLLRNAWPLLLLWYSTVIFFVLCTEKGRNARHYVWLKVCRSTMNERIVDRFLYTHGFITTNPFQPPSSDAADGGGGRGRDPSQQPLTWLPVARPVEDELAREPTELVLKTRIYHGRPETTTTNSSSEPSLSNSHSKPKPKNQDDVETGDIPGETMTTSSAVAKMDDYDGGGHDGSIVEDMDVSPAGLFPTTSKNDKLGSHDTIVDNNNNVFVDDDDDEEQCTICFSSLETGDRVGVLPCQHTFHVDCLKDWLPRRNVCPLCQNDHAATPRYTTNITLVEEDGGDAEDADAEDEGDTDSNNSNGNNAIQEVSGAEGNIDNPEPDIELAPMGQGQQQQTAEEVEPPQQRRRQTGSGFGRRILAAIRS